jgi:toxin ParE1/3/4
MAERRRPALWSPEAIDDLNGIWDHYAAAAGARTADDVVRRIGRAVAVLEEQPMAGRSRDEIRLDLRSIAVSPHVIFYRVVGMRGEIVRVLDGRRDIDEIFAQEDPDHQT